MPPHRAPTDTSAPGLHAVPSRNGEHADPLPSGALRGLAGLSFLLALSAGPALSAPAPAAPPADRRVDPALAAAALADARDRAAQAAARVEELKRELGPGHLTDAMPEIDRLFGLASLRSDYADAERRAAGYRATLGDQHPTLLATLQLLDDLRGQLLDATRKALAAAERDAAEAKADAASAERRLADGEPPRPSTADVTGSIGATSPHPATPLSLPRAAASAPPTGAGPAHPPADAPAVPTLAAAFAAAALAALAAGFALLRLLRPRHRGTGPAASPRLEPALAVPPGPAPLAAPEPVPVLTRLALSRHGDVAALDEGSSEPADVAVAARLHGTLRAAFGRDDGRMTVLVSPGGGLPDAEADDAALAITLAAAAAGRRPLLMEARGAGRLRGAAVPAGAAPMLVEVGGAIRTLYRLGRGSLAAAVLPSDAGEAEAAAAAASRSGTPRLRGLESFDTVILVGDDAAGLAPSADLLLLAAPPGTGPAALAAAAQPLRGAGRPCGAVLVERAGAALRPATLPRRPLPDPAPRLGLRGTIEPTRRRIAG